MGMQNKGQRFVVVFEDRDTCNVTKVAGPYRSFRVAEGIAKAEHGGVVVTYVMPLTKATDI